MIGTDEVISVARSIFRKTFPNETLISAKVYKHRNKGLWEVRLLDSRNCYYVVPVDISSVKLEGDFL